MGISVESTEWLLLHYFQVANWNLDMLDFAEGGKLEYPEKNPLSGDENKQQTQPTYDAETGNRTRATLVRGECSHHCVIPAPSELESDNRQRIECSLYMAYVLFIGSQFSEL